MIKKTLEKRLEYYEKLGIKFLNISEKKIIFKSKLAHMTFEHYILTPKSLVEWAINKKLYQNPSLIKTFDSVPTPWYNKFWYNEVNYVLVFEFL